MEHLNIAMVAGEVSGDLLASLMMRGLKDRFAHSNFYGIGGPQMEALGFQSKWSYKKLAVRGYFEVLKHYKEIVGIRDQMFKLSMRQAPDVFIGIDAPDFNLDLARRFKRQGVLSVQFVCPSIWAWRAKRVHSIAQSVDHVLCLFPFEPKLLAAHGIEATFVGHPLAQVIPDDVDLLQARKSLGLAAHAPLVALLPGSRQSEIEHMTRRFLLAAKEIHNVKPEIRFVLPTPASGVPFIQAVLRETQMSALCTLLVGRSHACLAACDVAMVASGTATLEAALFKKPMVIAYHMNAFSWQIIKRQRLQPWVGLPNILCEEFVVPELLQSECTPENLAHETLKWFNQAPRVAQLVERFKVLHQSLKRDTPLLCADALQTLLNRSRQLLHKDNSGASL
jgi:lipid-A-disaccharide synthase